MWSRCIFNNGFCSRDIRSQVKQIFNLNLYSTLNSNRSKKNMGRTDFSDQFRQIMIRHKRIGYDLNVMRQSE